MDWVNPLVNITFTPDNNNTVFDEIDDYANSYIEGTILSVTFLLGAPINIRACVELHRRNRILLQNSSYQTFVLLKKHLNISDLMVIFIFVTYKLYLLAITEWTGGSALCKLVNFANIVAFQFSSNIIACIALDRLFQARNSSSYAKVRLMVSFAWGIALILAIPQLFVWDSLQFDTGRHCTTMDNHNNTNISANWSTLTYVNNITHIVTVFWLPLAIIVICYLMIVRIVVTSTSIRTPMDLRLSESRSRRCSSQPESRKNELGQLLSRTGKLRSSDSRIVAQRTSLDVAGSNMRSKTCRLMGILVLAFVICWTPYNLTASVSLIETFRPAKVFRYFSTLIAFNSVINPCIYGSYTCRKRCSDR